MHGEAHPRKKDAVRVGRRREVAGLTGLEPAASGVTGRRSNQLNNPRVCDLRFSRRRMGTRGVEQKRVATGLEPAASGVTGRRSNQLNYNPMS